jgi:hypothetical protein
MWPTASSPREGRRHAVTDSDSGARAGSRGPLHVGKASCSHGNQVMLSTARDALAGACQRWRPSRSRERHAGTHTHTHTLTHAVNEQTVLNVEFESRYRQSNVDRSCGWYYRGNQYILRMLMIRPNPTFTGTMVGATISSMCAPLCIPTAMVSLRMVA